jgi:hypothetical protein
VKGARHRIGCKAPEGSGINCTPPIPEQAASHIQWPGGMQKPEKVGVPSLPSLPGSVVVPCCSS